MSKKMFAGVKFSKSPVEQFYSVTNVEIDKLAKKVAQNLNVIVDVEA
jgi:hypothetical protein